MQTNFLTDIHELRPHPGQKEVALRFRSLLDSDHHPSEIAGECRRLICSIKGVVHFKKKKDFC